MITVFLLYHTCLLAQFPPWKPLAVMPASADTTRTCCSRISALHQPTVFHMGHHPSWLPTQIHCFPLSHSWRTCCPPRGPAVRSLIPQPPWKERWSCDWVAANDGSARRFWERFCCLMRSAHWRLYFLCVAGPLVCEDEVLQAATATSVTKRMAGRSAQSLRSWAARPAGPIQASCWIRPIGPS